ncbi:glycosyltransferase [Streptomyces sp. NPDC050856]|uniref:glycosyltransferase n=1 Tax=Streptomyces sp. NPDC050856 TaxID=3154939 RepID=UPI00340AEC9F
MRVLCVSTVPPSHIHETLRFSRLLAEAGHDVLIATEEHLLGAFLDDGLAATACLPSLFEDALAAGEETHRAARLLRTGRVTFESAARVLAGPHMGGQLQALAAVAQKFEPDLILRDGMDVSACLVAEKAGVPHVALPSGAKGYTHPAALLPHLDRWRSAIGLPARGDPLSLTAYGHLDHLPPAWSFTPHLPPAYAYRQPAPARPHARLPGWVADLPTDRPLVYAGIGRALPRFQPPHEGPAVLPGQPDAVAVLRAVVAGLSRLECVAVVSTSGVTVHDLEPAPHVRVVESLAQPLLLEAADLFLTPGGYSSVREAVRTATPMAVLPQMADQPHNARRVTELGLGGLVTDPSAAGIASACRRLLADPAVPRRAKQARLATLALPTAEKAVHHLERLVEHHAATDTG